MHFTLSLLLITSFTFATDHKYPIKVLGGDEASFVGDATNKSIVEDEYYDVVIVGGGLAGLTAGIYLTDNNKRVLILEKEKHLGGLAAGTTLDGIPYAHGAAYWTNAYEEELKILEHINLGNFKVEHEIPEPIDSLYFGKTLYLHLWDDKTVERLPSSFALFKYELKKADEDKLIPNQPFEDAENSILDEKIARDWINNMPNVIAGRDDEEAKKIYKRFQKEIRKNKLDKANPMKDVMGFLDNFSRSALGHTTDKVSAMSFANFYISEIEPRYTTISGTGKAAENMVTILGEKEKENDKLIDILKEAAVSSIDTFDQATVVEYVYENQKHIVYADYVVFAAQLKFAPKLIRDFSKDAPEQAKLMSDLGYSHYSVHGVLVKGHPFTKTYDTWFRPWDFKEGDFTDLIVGRWIETEGYKTKPKEDYSILSIYHPLTQDWLGTGYTEQDVKKLVTYDVDRLIHWLNALPSEFRKEIKPSDILSVQTMRWPFSVHITEPGHFTKKAKILRKPYGRIYFAHSNIGSPSFEEALFRGHCAANNILLKSVAGFEQEEWTNCPVD